MNMLKTFSSVQFTSLSVSLSVWEFGDVVVLLRDDVWACWRDESAGS